MAWTPPGFAAFDTGRIGDEPDVAAAVEPPAPDAAEAGASAGPEAEAAETAAETVDATARIEGNGSDGNGHAAPPDDVSGRVEAEPDETGAEAADAADGAGDGPMPPAPMNGHDPARDPMAIPEFLRRVH